MIRVALSSFWRKNKEKIIYILKRFALVVLISIAAGTLFSQMLKQDNKRNADEEKKVYNPSKTIISGTDISEKEYEEDDNIIETFVTYCNEQKISEAYDMLTDNCKEKLYPTLKDFKNNYYNIIFQEKREYSLQSWINEEGYSTYRISFIGDIMSTGEYDNTEKFEDYITIVEDEGNEKININNYIKTEKIEKTTKTNQLEITVNNVDIYNNYVIYYLNINNTSEYRVLLDSLDNKNNISLLGTNNREYALDGVNLYTTDLLIHNGSRGVSLKLKFAKQHGSDVEGKSIEFKKVITNYDEYIKNKKDYDNYEEISIKL